MSDWVIPSKPKTETFVSQSGKVVVQQEAFGETSTVVFEISDIETLISHLRAAADAAALHEVELQD